MAVRRKSRANIANEEEVENKRRRRKRRQPAPRLDEEEVPLEEKSADEILDEANAEEDEEEPQILFQSSRRVSENGKRFWGSRRAIMRLADSASSYCSYNVGVAKYLQEIMVTVDVEDHFISATGVSNFDSGEFINYEDFETDSEENIQFSIEPKMLQTALDIISSPTVTLELVPDENDDTKAQLWVLDQEDNGQHTHYIVGVPNDDTRLNIPEGNEKEMIGFQPEAFLSSYSEIDRCRGENDLAQVFATILEEDDVPYIRFAASDKVKIGISHAALDEYTGDKLKRINLNPDSINKALPFMNEGTYAQLMVSNRGLEQFNDEEVEDWEQEDYESANLPVLLKTFDEKNRKINQIELSMFISRSDNKEQQIISVCHDALKKYCTVVSVVDYDKFSLSCSNADRVHSLNPENKSDPNSRQVYVTLNNGTLEITSHNPKNKDFGTRSTVKMKELDDSGKHNADFDTSSLISIPSFCLNVIDRFDPQDDDSEAVIALASRSNEDSDGPDFFGMILLRKDEAKEWNEDDDIPKFMTMIGIDVPDYDEEEYEEDDFDEDGDLEDEEF